VRAAIIATATLAILATGGFYWYIHQPIAEGSTPLEASGTIEAKEVTIAPEVGGRVVEITADEGEEVEAGHAGRCLPPRPGLASPPTPRVHKQAACKHYW
jgi:multidrug efflux pump subunit AcrA (membrane-fusion protein)